MAPGVGADMRAREVSGPPPSAALCTLPSERLRRQRCTRTTEPMATARTAMQPATAMRMVLRSGAALDCRFASVRALPEGHRGSRALVCTGEQHAGASQVQGQPTAPGVALPLTLPEAMAAVLVLLVLLEGLDTGDRVAALVCVVDGWGVVDAEGVGDGGTGLMLVLADPEAVPLGLGLDPRLGLPLGDPELLPVLEPLSLGDGVSLMVGVAVLVLVVLPLLVALMLVLPLLEALMLVLPLLVALMLVLPLPVLLTLPVALAVWLTLPVTLVEGEGVEPNDDVTEGVAVIEDDNDVLPDKDVLPEADRDGDDVCDVDPVMLVDPVGLTEAVAVSEGDPVAVVDTEAVTDVDPDFEVDDVAVVEMVGVTDTVADLEVDGVALTVMVGELEAVRGTDWLALGVSDTLGVTLGVSDTVGEAEEEREVEGLPLGVPELEALMLVEGEKEAPKDWVGVTLAVGVVDGDLEAPVAVEKYVKLVAHVMSGEAAVHWCTSTAMMFCPSTSVPELRLMVVTRALALGPKHTVANAEALRTPVSGRAMFLDPTSCSFT